MKSIVYDHSAAAQADANRPLWKRAELAIETVEWTLARDPEIGVSLVDGGDVLMAVFDGARSIGMPTVEVLYRNGNTSVEIIDLEFRNA